VTLQVAGNGGVIGCRVQVLTKDGKLLGVTISAAARHAVGREHRWPTSRSPGAYRVEVRLKFQHRAGEGDRRGRQSPEGMIDNQTPLVK
jgi:hypothetical protein